MLKSIFLSSTLISIEENSLFNCTSLEYVYHYSKKRPENIGKGFLSNCKTNQLHVFSSSEEYGNIKGIEIVGPSGKSNEVYYHISNDRNTLVFYGLGYMEGDLYYKQPWRYDQWNLRTVRIEYGVKNIGNHAFWNNNHFKISNIYIASTVTSIGKLAIHQCSSLETITIPSSVTSI